MGLAARLIAALRGRKVSPAEVFDLARQDRLTGSVTFHFRDGVPRSVTHGQPYQTDLVEEECTQSGMPLEIPVGVGNRFPS